MNEAKLGDLKIGSYFRRGNTVYSILDDARREPLYFVVPEGILLRYNKESMPEFKKFGRRKPVAMRKETRVMTFNPLTLSRY